MPSTLPISNSFSTACRPHERAKSPCVIRLPNQCSQVVTSTERSCHAFICRCLEKAFCISRSRLLISACSLSLSIFTLQAQVTTPITATNGETLGAIIATNPTHNQNARQSTVLKALAAATEARQTVAVIERIHKMKSEPTNHPADATATNKLVKSNEPKQESLAQ